MEKATNYSENNGNQICISVIILFAIVSLLINSGMIFAAPSPPDFLNITSNTTRTSPSTKMVNISGGYIAVMNITATIQNVRWKAFVGNVSGVLTLQDGTGSRIYGWTLTSFTGRVYSTRNSSSPTWTSINCSNVTTLEAENILLEHSNVNDNLTATFNISENASHVPFTVAGRYMINHSCPTLNTYVDNATQDSDFEEVALYDDVNIIYAALLENKANGYDSLPHDFQMIVPENGNPIWTGSTAYYMYVEID